MLEMGFDVYGVWFEDANQSLCDAFARFQRLGNNGRAYISLKQQEDRSDVNSLATTSPLPPSLEED